MEELKARLGKIVHLADSTDCILLTQKDMGFDPNFVYFTNLNDVAGVFLYNFSKTRLLTNSRDFSMAKKGWVRDVEMPEKNRLEELVKGKRVGVDMANLDALTFDRLKKMAGHLVDVSAHLEAARSIKTRYEVRCLKKACLLSGKVWKRVRSQWRGLTESEFKALIEYEITRLGVEPSFPTTVASGKNIRFPHLRVSNQKMGLPFLVDFGVRYNNYVSDVTRTVGSKWEDMIKKVLEDLYPQIVPGARASRLDVSVRKALGGEGKHFVYSLGHGIGVSLHEKPSISSNSKDILKEGMVFTIEPGLAVGNGIRIENDFLLKRDGLENLTDWE